MIERQETNKVRSVVVETAKIGIEHFLTVWSAYYILQGLSDHD